MKALLLPSPAKINLFLHVVGRKKDGYHLLQTAFQFVDFSDEMSFALRDDDIIELDAPLLNIPVNDNLIMRAARLLKQVTSSQQGASISLKKRIPLGGGLGGASSNAATTLIALNLLWNTKLANEELCQLGLTLGADVPIFIAGFAAFAEGVGEKLKPIFPAENWVLLLFPGCHVPTEKIFCDFELTRNTPEITINEFFEQGGHNDCEPIARKHFPKISEAIDCLNPYAPAKMTGTGSTVFATFTSKEAAVEVASKIPVEYNGIVVRGLNKSPLHDSINKIIGVSPSGKAQGFDLCIPRFES